MAADVLDVIPGQLEAVKADLEMLFEQSDQIASMVKKTNKVQQVSRYMWRLPMKKYNGGHFAKFVGNAGALPEGTGMVLSSLQAAYFYSALGFRVTMEQIDTSANPSQSVVNVLSDTLANAMVEAGVLDDIAFHTKGDGILTGPCSAITNTTNATMTFAVATDYLNVNRLREGMCVDVWTYDGATKRSPTTGDPLIIIAIDWDAKKVTFNQEVTGLSAGNGTTTGDLIAFRGMAAYGPSTLTTFSSTYPTAVASQVGSGIGGDSFRHGFPYMTDTTSSNYFYGKQKSSIPQLNPVRVNAQSNPFEWDHMHRIIAKLQRRRSNEVWKGLIGIAPMAQRAQVFALGMSIANRQVGDNFGKSLDAIPENIGYDATFNLAGVPCYISKRQARDRIDFINPSKIGRAQLFDTKFAEIGGRTTFEVRNSSGQVVAAQEFWIVQAYDFVGFDSGCFGVIDTLALPSNWDD
jgi:hypothetical protein